jgi:hypothetical protein
MKSRTLAAVVACSFAWLPACSGPEAPLPGGAAREGARPAAVAATGQKADRPAAGGDCDLLTRAEIEQAFGGALTVTRVSGRGDRGSGCTVTMAQGEHSELVFQVGDRAAFDMRREGAEGQSRITSEPIDLGVEAYLLNGAQVIALDAEGRSVSLGLTLIVMGGALPVDEATVAAGVRGLAGKVLARL